MRYATHFNLLLFYHLGHHGDAVVSTFTSSLSQQELWSECERFCLYVSIV